MPENQSSASSSLKTQLSLASLMFFGPFIKHFLREDDAFDISESDKTFIKGYMILGTFNLGLAALVLCFGLLSAFFDFQWLSILFVIFSSALLLVLVAGTIAIFANISFKTSSSNNLTASIGEDFAEKNNVVLHYLPIVNTYIRYKLHNFEGDLYILKESQILWTLFGLICLSQNLRFIGILLVIIIMRIAVLMMMGDPLPPAWKDLINRLFHKNIEEIWGLILGTAIGAITYLFNKKEKISGWQEHLQTPYSYLYDLSKYGSIIWQFVLLILITGYSLSTIPTWTRFGFVIIGTLLLWGRYLIMGIAWKHLPPLPLVDDIFRSIKHIFEHKSA